MRPLSAPQQPGQPPQFSPGQGTRLASPLLAPIQLATFPPPNPHTAVPHPHILRLLTP